MYADCHVWHHKRLNAYGRGSRDSSINFSTRSLPDGTGERRLVVSIRIQGVLVLLNIQELIGPVGEKQKLNPTVVVVILTTDHGTCPFEEHSYQQILFGVSMWSLGVLMIYIQQMELYALCL